MSRRKLIPHTYCGFWMKRSWEYGMRSSAVQPSESRLTFPSHTPSHELSSHSSLYSVPSESVPAALMAK